jgi:hypothetical protein
MAFEMPSYYFEKYNNYQTNGQSALLQSVKSSIQTTYPSTYIGGDGQVVVVEFSDGMKFEVIPVFESNEGGFIYPDSNYGGSWKKTDPKPEIKAMKELDSRCNGNLKWLCRMMREWKLYWDVPIKGILIDSLAYEFISNWEYKENSFIYYDWMTRDFFEFLQTESAKDYWFAPGSYDLIYNTDSFEYKAKRCYNISLEAISYASDGYEYTSRTKWREIFGTTYPR